jgi:hypothetical protein
VYQNTVHMPHKNTALITIYNVFYITQWLTTNTSVAEPEYSSSPLRHWSPVSSKSRHLKTSRRNKQNIS